MEVKRNFREALEQSFSRYAGGVIQSRALVDSRDGIKPSARQLLYAQFLEKITHNKPYAKSAKSVSAGLTHFYTHGDTSCYSTLMRMGKPFATRYPLEDVQGNFGTLIQSGSEAHYRYTEMRLSELSSYLFHSIDKNTIDEWHDNYDDTEKYPAVLPSVGFYNLVNGTMGIGVALASSIPPTNLREVNKAIVKLIENPDAPFDDIFCLPDFPTGATIINAEEIKESFLNGQGKACMLRATIDYNPKEHMLVVTEIPYGVYTNTLCEQLFKLLDENPSCGIEKFIDLTGENPLIKIKLSPKANPESVKKLLYKETFLQYHYSINMTMLEDGRYPKVYNWRTALLSHIEHASSVLYREYQYDLQKNKDRLHILNGLKVAVEHIDEFIKIIRNSQTISDAVSTMLSTYGLDEIQCKAILDIKLSRLIKLEYIKIQNEITEKENIIKDLEWVLSDSTEFKKRLSNKYHEVSVKFGDNRKTKVTNIVQDNGEELPIEEKKLVVSISNNGVILATDVDTFNKQARGGRGAAIKLKNNDFIIETIYGANSDNFMMLSNLGKSYTLNLGTLPLGEEIYLQSLLELSLNERITKIVSYDRLSDYSHITIVTKNGLIKKTAIDEYKSRRKGGLVGIKLREGDEVSAVLVSKEDDEIIIATDAGKNVRYPLSDINATGRATQGVKAIELPSTDSVVGAVNFNPKDFKGLITISAKGMAKVSDLEEYTYSSRNSKGTNVLKLKEDTLAGIGLQQDDNADIIVATSTNIIRFSAAELRNSGKNTIGTTTIKLASNAKILYIGQVA